MSVNESVPNVRKPMIDIETQRRMWRYFVYFMLAIVSLFFLLPIYLVIITSLKQPTEIIDVSAAWDFPDKLQFSSFETAWKNLGDNLRNSLLIVVTGTALSSMIGSLNGYVLSKWRIPGANVLFPLMLFGMFIPYQAVLIPLFSFIRDIGLAGDMKALILTHVVYGIPITTLIFRNFYVEIPDELVDAGKIDGAGFFGIYRHIIFPLSIPGFVVVVIWQFTQIWNEFLFAVTLVETDQQPITVPLAQLAGGEAVRWNEPMAGAILAAIPTLLVYIVLGRYFIRGLLAGSIKG